MLDLLRRKAQSPYLQATVLIIIVVFVFWGVGGNQSDARNAVATVNGEPITLEEFDKALKRTMDQYSAQFGGTIPKGLLEALNIKKQVINELIQRSLLSQGGKAMGIYVSDMEIQDAIKNMTVFQNNGVFDNDRYNEVLRGSRLTPKKFESTMRSDLLASKVANEISGFSQVSSFELDNRFRFENSEFKLDYAAFEADNFSSEVELTDEALTAYFAENKDTYKTAPQVKVKYLSFLIEDEIAAISLPESEITEYYASHQEEFGQPEKRKASHILLRTSGQDSEAKRQEMDKILIRARAGEDFAALAKEFSDDGSASRGGDLGFFGRGQMVKPFEDAVFSLQNGEISDIVTTQFGHHIIKLEEIQAAIIKDLAEVRPIIENKLKKQQAQNNSFEKANDAYEKIIFSGSLDNYADKFSITVSATDFFPQSNPPAALGTDPSIAATAFSLKKKELSSLLETSQGYTILFIEDTKEPEIPELAQVREKVEQDFIQAEAKAIAQKKADETLAKLKEGADFNQTLQEMGITPQQSEYFSRSKRSSKGLPEALLSSAFTLSVDNPYPATITASGSTFYLCRFKEKKEADLTEENQQLKSFESKIAMEQQNALMDGWIAQLMKKGKVTINAKYME